MKPFQDIMIYLHGIQQFETMSKIIKPEEIKAEVQKPVEMTGVENKEPEIKVDNEKTVDLDGKEPESDLQAIGQVSVPGSNTGTGTVVKKPKTK